jgi:hypothetical protein
MLQAASAEHDRSDLKATTSSTMEAVTVRSFLLERSCIILERFTYKLASKIPEKNPAAVALGRRGGRKGGLARAAKLTPEERSKIARKAVRARWDKANSERELLRTPKAARKNDTSDDAVLQLLHRIKTTEDPTEIRKLSDELERVIFHKQYRTA